VPLSVRDDLGRSEAKGSVNRLFEFFEQRIWYTARTI
jgi:hypothetical protein